MRISNWLALLIVLIFLSCSSKAIFDEELIIENSEWNINNRAAFVVDVSDTLGAHDIFISIENTSNYYFSNIYIFSQIIFPSGLIITDTVEYILSDEKGQWVGSGIGSNYKNTFLFKQNVRFPLQGKYEFKFQQGMRCSDDGFLDGISSFGLQIKKK